MASDDKVNILLVDDQPAKLLSYETILAELGEGRDRQAPVLREQRGARRTEAFLHLVDDRHLLGTGVLQLSAPPLVVSGLA